VRELHASTVQLVWIVDAYNLMFAALVLAAGNLGDRVGRKGVLLVGLLVFGAASLAGGLGNSPGQLIAARAVMGLGAALIFPATLSLLTNVFTERRERARAIGLWGASTGVGIAVGPIIGGWLLERFSWSSVFFALVRSPPPRRGWSPSLYRPPAIPRPLPPTGPGCCSRPPPWPP
jgi:MFS family permease